MFERRILTLLAGMLAVGCVKQKNVTPSVPASDAAHEKPVIVHIISRHHTVTITASKRGPLYAINDAQGRTRVAGATLEELRTQHPDLYEQFAPAIAEQMADLSNDRATSTLMAPRTLEGGQFMRLTPAAESPRFHSAE